MISKGALLSCGIMFGIGAMLFYLCRILMFVELLVLGRFVVGLSSGVTTAVLAMYLSEIPPSELRGTLAVFSGLGKHKIISKKMHSTTYFLYFIYVYNTSTITSLFILVEVQFKITNKTHTQINVYIINA